MIFFYKKYGIYNAYNLKQRGKRYIVAYLTQRDGIKSNLSSFFWSELDSSTTIYYASQSIFRKREMMSSNQESDSNSIGGAKSSNPSSCSLIQEPGIQVSPSFGFGSCSLLLWKAENMSINCFLLSTPFLKKWSGIQIRWKWNLIGLILSDEHVRVFCRNHATHTRPWVKWWMKRFSSNRIHLF